MSAGRRLMQLTRFFADNYFRSVVIEEYEKLTDLNEPVILASNHSGMSFPWDNFVLFDLLLERCEGRLSITGLLAPILLDNPLLSPFALPDASYFFSAPATMKNFEELMQKRASVFINPEGIAGIGKGFNHRYELQPFSSSFIRMCIKYDRPLIPISIVNGEYLNPYAYSSRTLNKVLNLIGMPFLPLGPTIILCAIFPFVAYIALPARLHYVIGRRIDVKKMAAKPYEQMSVEEIKALTEQVRQIMQTNLDASVEKYGKVPYGWRSFLSSFRKLGWKSVALIPITWPFMV
ncbi:MAG: 1-acyl-sn-glycerol-3-phosphate acyltransferase, partial [Bdellovibrionales bacterium]